MKGLKILDFFKLLAIIAVIGFITLLIYLFQAVSYNPVGDKYPSILSVACSNWQDKGFPDAKTITISNYDVDRDGSIEPGTTCAQDNLETLGENIYITGTCADGIGTNEDLIRTRVCGFS